MQHKVAQAGREIERRMNGGVWSAAGKALAQEAIKFAKFSGARRAIVSYPKSGGTWLNYMLAHTAAASQGKRTEETVDLSHLSRTLPGVPRIVWTHDGSEIVNERGDHPDPAPLFSYSGRPSYRARDVLLLIRDPRDITVSYYHQATKRTARPLPVSSMSEFVRHPQYGIARVIRFYEIWQANLDKPRRIEIVRYEDLLSGGPEKLLDVARFLGIPCNRANVEEAFENSRIEKMREKEKSGAIGGMRRFGDDPNALKARKGKAGGYAEELSEDDIRFCDQAMAKLPELFKY